MCFCVLGRCGKGWESFESFHFLAKVEREAHCEGNGERHVRSFRGESNKPNVSGSEENKHKQKTASMSSGMWCIVTTWDTEIFRGGRERMAQNKSQRKHPYLLQTLRFKGWGEIKAFHVRDAWEVVSSEGIQDWIRVEDEEYMERWDLG